MLSEYLNLLFTIVLSLFVVYGSLLISKSDLSPNDRLFSLLLVLFLFLSVQVLNDYKLEKRQSVSLEQDHPANATSSFFALPPQEPQLHQG